MVVSSITKAGGYTDPKGNFVKVGSNGKPVASQTVSNTDMFPVDNRLVLKDGTTYGSKGPAASGSKTTTSFDSSGNQVGQTTINYGGGGTAQRSSAVTPVTPAYSPLVKSTVQPTGALRNADGNYSLDTQGYEENEKKRKQALGIVDITQSVQNGVEGSPKFFDQGEYVDNAKQAIDMLQNKSLETEGAVGGEERMARQRQEAADKAIQDELQGLNRAGQLFDRQNENLLQSKDRTAEQTSLDVERAKEDRKFQLDEYRKNTTRNIEDTAKQRDDTMQSIRRQSAALGLNVTSTYNQNYKTTLDKFNNVINRMSEDLNTQEGRTALEDKRLDADYTRATKQLLQDYERDSTRLKQDFEFATRDYRENLILDANKLVEQYGLSSDKLGARLQELSLGAFNAVNEAYGSFLDNTQKQTDILDSQVNNVLDTRNKYLTQQKTYADNFLAGSQNMTIQDLNAMVRDGQISEQMAQQTLGQVVQMALDTIDTATVDGVGVQFQDQIIEAINAGMTPMQAIQQVMASEEFAPVVAKMQEMGLSSYQKAISQLQIQQGQLGLQKGQQELQKGNLDYQAQLQDYVAGQGATGDLRGLASQFPGQAWAKNNNPGGLTWGVSQGLKDAWSDAGIDFGQGTPRPSGEGGAYISFNTIEDGMGAQRIALSRGGGDINARLQKWVGTKEGPKYAAQVMGWAGIPNGTKFTDLSDEQANALQMAVIRKESPGLAKLLLQGGGNQDEKDTLLSLVKKGGLTKTDQMEIADKALKQGRSKDFNEALKKGAVVDLSDGQITQYNKETDRFLGNAVVKGFEEGLTQFQGLGHALSEKSGPGDMAGVFTFMKTLDPTSVVREQEFENAAKSAGVAERRGNVYDNLTEGKILTSSQAEDFKKIAKVFIEQKAQSYDRLYANMLNSYDNFGIPQDLAPLKASDQLREYLVSTGQTPTKNVPTTAPANNVPTTAPANNVPTTAPANNNLNRINQLRVSVPLANIPLSPKFD